MVLHAIRKDGGYVAGEEKLATDEMSEDDFIAKALLMTQSKIDRVSAERDAYKNEFENVTIAA